MSAKARAQQSSTAMAAFIEEGFPTLIADHNSLAQLLNEEIDRHEHAGYEPVMFPILPGEAEDNLDGGNEEEIDVSPSLKRAAAESPSEESTGPTTKRRKTTKTSPTGDLEPMTTPEPELSADRFSLPSQPNEAGSKTTGQPSRAGSPPASVQPELLHGEQDPQHEIEVIGNASSLRSPIEEVSVAKSNVETSEELENKPSDKDDDPSRAPIGPHHALDELHESPSFDMASALAVVEGYNWGMLGLRWEPGRGLVTIHDGRPVESWRPWRT